MCRHRWRYLIQGVLDYLDLDYRNPHNTGIYHKFQVIRLSGLFTNNSLQYHIPDHRGLGFFFDYLELFLALVIPIMEDLLYLKLFIYVAVSCMYLIVHRVWIELLSQLNSNRNNFIYEFSTQILNFQEFELT